MTLYALSAIPSRRRGGAAARVVLQHFYYLDRVPFTAAQLGEKLDLSVKQVQRRVRTLRALDKPLTLESLRACRP